MVLGQKIWEGKGKSTGPGIIKSIDMQGVTSLYTWTAELKGVGRANGVDGNLNVTGVSMTPPKGMGMSKDQAIFMTMTGDMAVVKGMDLMKMRPKPMAVGLWSFMTMSEKLGWLNEVAAVVVFEAVDPMWMEVNVSIYEWTF
jgi:hypothetical protein